MAVTFVGYELATYELLRLLQVAPSILAIEAAHSRLEKLNAETAALRSFAKPVLDSAPLLKFVATTLPLTMRPVEVETKDVEPEAKQYFTVKWGESLKSYKDLTWVSEAAQTNPFVRLRDASTQLGIPFWDLRLDYDRGVFIRQTEQIDLLSSADSVQRREQHYTVNGAAAIAVYSPDDELHRVVIRSYCAEHSAACWLMGILQKVVRRHELVASKQVRAAHAAFEMLTQEQKAMYLRESSSQSSELVQ